MIQAQDIRKTIERDFLDQLIVDLTYDDQDHSVLFILENGTSIGLNTRISWSDYELSLVLTLNSEHSTYYDPTLDIGNLNPTLTHNSTSLTSRNDVQSCVKQKLVGYRITTNNGISVILKFSNNLFLHYEVAYGADRKACYGMDE